MFGFLKRRKERDKDNFLKDVGELMEIITGRLNSSTKTCEVSREMDMLRDLSDRGLPYAQYVLGIALLDQDKEWYDSSEGIEVLRKLADAGVGDAQFDLALFHYHGAKDFPQDPITGHYWMRKAAESGFPAAVEFMESRK